MEERNRKEHPSYGMISISHVSRGGKGQTLFGSGIRHNHYLELRIYEGEVESDMYRTSYFQRKSKISVCLSPAQLSGLITRTNTEGVPCTINWTEQDGYIEPCPDSINTRQDMMEDIKKRYTNLAKTVKELQAEIDQDLKGAVTAARKEKIKGNITKICNDVSSNLAYLQECQIDALEKIGNEIVSEAEAAVSSMIKSIGIENIKKDFKKIE